MSDVAIRVENLSKLYRIGGPQARYQTLRDTVMDVAAAPIQRLRRLRQPAQPDHTIWALKDVSFEVQQGEVLGIIGRNGAGKSTLLKILSRITEPTEGQANIYGRVGSLLEVGTGFHPELTGRENIYLSGAILGMTRTEIDEKFDEIVDFAGIEKFLDTPAKRYSSGMYVRLAFAVAAHLEPEILLVDEVLAVGDASFQKKCLSKMDEVAGQGRTVLFVSHNMGAVVNLCRRAIQLDNGRLSREGGVADIVAQYLAEGMEAKGSSEIPADESRPTDEFRFCSVSVLNPGDGPSRQVSQTEGLEVDIEYEIRSPIRGANVVCHLWNNRGDCVLTSTDVDQDPTSVSALRDPGRYVARCRVPSQYLRPGRYCIGVSCSIPRVRVLANLPRVLSFDVVDTGNMEWRQGREGVVAPILEWTTRRALRQDETDYR
jgi:lipopolysaccharide transport system ATP-binding protein